MSPVVNCTSVRQIFQQLCNYNLLPACWPHCSAYDNEVSWRIIFKTNLILTWMTEESQCSACQALFCDWHHTNTICRFCGSDVRGRSSLWLPWYASYGSVHHCITAGVRDFLHCYKGTHRYMIWFRFDVPVCYFILQNCYCSESLGFIPMFARFLNLVKLNYILYCS